MYDIERITRTFDNFLTCNRLSSPPKWLLHWKYVTIYGCQPNQWFYIWVGVIRSLSNLFALKKWSLKCSSAVFIDDENLKQLYSYLQFKNVNITGTASIHTQIKKNICTQCVSKMCHDNNFNQ